MNGSSAAASPEQYIAELDEPRKSQVQELFDLIKSVVPRHEPHLQSGMIGFGKYHYKYATGREGEWFYFGLASLKTGISVYVCAVDDRGYVAERNKYRFPRATVGRSCLRFKRFEDIDQAALAEVLKEADSIPPVGAV